MKDAIKLCGIRTDIWPSRETHRQRRLYFPLPDPKDYQKATLQPQRFFLWMGLYYFLQLN